MNEAKYITFYWLLEDCNRTVIPAKKLEEEEDE